MIMKLILSLAIILTSFVGITQTEINASSEWRIFEVRCVDLYCIESFYEESLTSDTIIDNKEYYKLSRYATSIEYFQTNPDHIISTNVTDMYRGALRSEEGIWYWIPKDTISESVLYDFNISDGDSLQFPDFDFKFELSLVDSILHNNLYREVYQVGPLPYTIIEGVGLSSGLTNSLIDNLQLQETFSYLNCYSKDGSSISPDHSALEEEIALTFLDPCQALIVNSEDLQEKKISVFPNPVSDILWIDTDLLIESIAVYNQQGEQIQSYNQTVSAIDISFLDKGIYYLLIRERNNPIPIVEKFIRL